MRMVLRIGIVTVLICLVGSVAFASGQAENDDRPQVYAGWSGSEGAAAPVFAEKIERWNSENPDSPFEWVGWPWGDTLDQLIIRSQGGERLDVAQVQLGWAEVLAPTGLLMDLDELIGREWLEENIPASSLAAGVIGGEQLAVPYTSASIGMVHSPSLLEAAGIDEVPTTTAEFETALEAIAEYDPDAIPYAMTTTGAGSVAQDLNAWFWTFGGEIIDDDGNVVIDSPENAAAIEWIQSLHERNLIALDMDRFDARVLFADGSVGFYDDAILARGIAVDNGVPEDNWDDHIFPMLRPVVDEGDDPQSGLWGHQLVIFENTSDAEAAADFIKHLISPEIGLLYFEETGLPPVHNDAIDDPIVQEDPWASVWLDITSYGSSHELLQFDNVSELQNILTEEFQSALISDISAEEMLQRVAERLDAAIN